MTATAATAQVDTARQTYAVPAEQNTLQEKERTKQTYAKAAAPLVLGTFVAGVAACFLTGGALAAVLTAVVGIFGAPTIIKAVKGKD